jgi:ribosomal protein S12 methylthiotransferase accessory factor
VTATLAHFDFRAVPRRERLNAGKGRTEAEATLAALGEAVERYSGYHWDPARVRVAPAPPGAITPADCVLHSETQYAAGLPYPRWSPSAETSWITGVELPSGEPVALPAALAYLVAPPPRPDHVVAVTSNGLAAGPDLVRAVLSGFAELVERDALMVTWMNRLPATEIETPERGCHAAGVIRHYRRFGVSVRLFLLATDQVHSVVLALLDNPTGAAGPLRVVGMGCELDPVAAVDKAVFEACQARPSEAVRFRESNPAARLRRYTDVRSLDDHADFHALPENASEMEFLWAGGSRVALDALPRPNHADPAAALDAVVARLRATGCRVAYAEITAPDVATTGLRVVRCFATGLQPIHFGHGEARLGGRRLFEAPVAWGLAAHPSTEAMLNPCPHPMA